MNKRREPSSCSEETDLHFSAAASLSILKHSPSVELYHPSSSSISHSVIRSERTVSFSCCWIIFFSWKTWLKKTA